MLKQLALLLLAGTVCFGGAACENKKTTTEFQAERVKAFQLKQKIAAIKSYQDLVTKYPDSPFAAEAQKRLTALGPPPSTPAKAKVK